MLKELPKANAIKARDSVFYRKLITNLKVLGLEGLVTYLMTGNTKEVFDYGIPVALGYTVGLVTILALMIAKTAAEGTASMGVKVLIDAVDKVRPWFGFLETMRAMHVLMQIVWGLLSLLYLVSSS